MSSRYFTLVLAAFIFTASTAQAQNLERPASPLFSVLQGVTLTSYVADAATSTYLFGQGTHREVGLGPTHNPLVFSLVKGGSAAGVLWATNQMRRAGHPKLALVVMIAASSFEFTLAARNARQVRR